MQEQDVPITTYVWHGQGVRVDLKTCREALITTLLKPGAPATIREFAQKLGVAQGTVYRLFRGQRLNRHSLTVILTGLGLTAEQVITQVTLG